MKSFIVEKVLYGGKWFYDNTSKTYKQKTMIMKEVKTFKEAIKEWRILRKANLRLNYRIICIEKEV